MTKMLPLQYAPALLVRNKIAPAISSSIPDLSSGILLLGKVPSPMRKAASSEGNTVKVSIVPSMRDIIYRALCGGQKLSATSNGEPL
jgi:hypothetical protein